MSTPSERLAESLAQLERLQRLGRRVFRSSEFTRAHRERLIQTGFLQDVMKGWLISTGPGADPGDTTAWFASFWEFCWRYSSDRFGDQWHLSPEQSMLLHGENTTIPQQVIVYTPAGTNNTVELPFGTSLYDLRDRQMPPPADVVERHGLRLYAPEAALTRVSESFLARHPVEAQVVLASVRDSSEVLRKLLEHGQSTVAGRLVGAFRRVGRDEIADEILAAMTAAGYDVREADPFAGNPVIRRAGSSTVPIVGRLHAIWSAVRNQVTDVFPEAPGLPQDGQAYLQTIDERYRSDAYHSLSIEGYRVTPELVERVKSGEWAPERVDFDRTSRDALAARGYWQAFGLVRRDVAEIIAGADPAPLVRDSYREWHRELFQPSVAAGIIPASALAGYRNETVLIQGSRHVPPRWEAVRDAMPALFDLLAAESEPSVCAVLGHWLFGYIHPFPDGNGRLARFLMNAMLASGGYPWTVIRVEHRAAYMAALESASVQLDLGPFARFIAERVAGTVRE